jgi:hypothetical protein
VTRQIEYLDQAAAGEPGRDYKRRLLAGLDLRPGQYVLDVGCGPVPIWRPWPTRSMEADAASQWFARLAKGPFLAAFTFFVVSAGQNSGM